MAEFGNYCIVEFCNKRYKIDKEKMMYIFSKLENKNIENMTENELNNYLKKYKMYDENILENLVRI